MGAGEILQKPGVECKDSERHLVTWYRGWKTMRVVNRDRIKSRRKQNTKQDLGWEKIERENASKYVSEQKEQLKLVSIP